MNRLVFSLVVIATTGDRFSDFAPYVASVNGAGTVAFQAALQGGGTGVFTGAGGPVATVAGDAGLGGVTSHPDLSDDGATCFYGELLDGGQGVFLISNGRLQTVAQTGSSFASIGPLGPTMNEACTVAFRADCDGEVSGVFAGDAASTESIADTGDCWSRFHGLPVINEGGVVLFRADRKDGIQGVYVRGKNATRAVAETGDRFETLAPFPSLNNDGTVAFAATLRSGGAGIFTEQEGQITPLVDTSGAFASFRGALISDSGEVVRIGTPRGGSLGLFSGPDPQRDRILAIGDALLGSTVAELAANPVSVNALGQVAVRARLADDVQLILRADPVG